MSSDPNGYGFAGTGNGTHTERLELDPLMLQAIAERREGRFADAANTLRSMIASQNIPIRFKQWAVSMLLAVGQLHGGLNLAPYVRQAIEMYPALRTVLTSVLPHMYLAEDDIGQALQAFDANIAAEWDSNLVKAALYGKFIVVLYTNSDTSTAQLMLGQLRDEFPASRQRRLAEVQMGTYQAANGGRQAGNIGKAVASGQLPESYKLLQNYPNPFNPTTTIKYELPVDAKVTLRVYDLLGKEVLTLVDGLASAGHHQVQLDASRLSSGVYFYRINAGSFTDVKKLLLLR